MAWELEMRWWLNLNGTWACIPCMGRDGPVGPFLPSTTLPTLRVQLKVGVRCHLILNVYESPKGIYMNSQGQRPWKTCEMLADPEGVARFRFCRAFV